MLCLISKGVIHWDSNFPILLSINALFFISWFIFWDAANSFFPTHVSVVFTFYFPSFSPTHADNAPFVPIFSDGCIRQLSDHAVNFVQNDEDTNSKVNLTPPHEFGVLCVIFRSRRDSDPHEHHAHRQLSLCRPRSANAREAHRRTNTSFHSKCFRHVQLKEPCFQRGHASVFFRNHWFPPLLQKKWCEFTRNNFYCCKILSLKQNSKIDPVI